MGPGRDWDSFTLLVFQCLWLPKPEINKTVRYLCHRHSARLRANLRAPYPVRDGPIPYVNRLLGAIQIFFSEPLSFSCNKCTDLFLSSTLLRGQ